MSLTTWNFPCWQCRDKGPNATPPATRATAGGGFGVEGVTLPFTNTITGIFSFFCETGKVADAAEAQMISSIGYQGAGAFAGMEIRLQMDATTPSNCFVLLLFYDWSGAVLRYSFKVGDENGTDWLKFDKWYQMAFCATITELTVVVNGSTTPTLTKSTDNPGGLNLDASTERWWHNAPSAAWGAADTTAIAAWWPSCVVGPSAWESTSLDLTNQANLDRIFDADGNFKNPGENGSLWFNDTYTTAGGFKPDVFLVDGGARFDNGSYGLTWLAKTGAGWSSCPGGLRKMYE